MKYLVITFVLAILATLLTPYLDKWGRKFWQYITIGYTEDKPNMKEGENDEVS